MDIASQLLDVLEPQKLLAILLYGAVLNGAGTARAKLSGLAHIQEGSLAPIFRSLMYAGSMSIRLLVLCLGMLAEGDRWLTQWIRRTFRIKDRM